MKGQIVSKDNTGKLKIALMQEADDNCKACGMGDSCGLTKLSYLEVDNGPEVENLNIDDYVDVEIPSKLFFWLTSSVYILPLFTMLFGAIIASFVFPLGGDKVAIVGGFSGFAVGIIFNVFLNKYLSLQRIVQIRRLA
ncbi:MAG: SoxR reducing system RseC family protein [Leptospirales bacterium]